MRWPSSPRRGIKTVDLEQRDREKRVEKILHQADDAELGNYAALHDEGDLRAAGRARSLDARAPGRGRWARRAWAACRRTSSACSTFAAWCFLACGTSLYSAQVGAYLMSRYARMPASAEDAAELAVQNPIVDRHTLYVGDLAERRDGRHAGGAARDQACAAAWSPASPTWSAARCRARRILASTCTPGRRSASARPRRSPRRCWRPSCWRCASRACATCPPRDGRAVGERRWRRCLRRLRLMLEQRRGLQSSSRSASADSRFTHVRGARRERAGRLRGRAQAEGDRLFAGGRAVGRRDEARALWR